MERYVEMGFQSDEAREATGRFGDDLHAGCHWLMVRQTMGNVPKRLKVSHQENTYLGSSIRLNGTTWTIDNFDSKHALVRIRRGENLPCRWEHMSDSRIEWLTITHERPSIMVPRAAWKRSIGHIQVCSKFLHALKTKLTLKKMLGIFIRWGRPSHDSVEWKKWRAVTALTREHVPRPSRQRPRGGFSSDVHDFRVEWMTYFHGLCDVHGVGIDTFSNALYNTTIAETSTLFPESIREDLTTKLTMWTSPTEYIKTELQKWRKDCLPVILFEPRDCRNDTIKFEVFIHDMTFVQPRHSVAGLHLQMQRLFALLFPKERPTSIPGPIDLKFFNNVLRACKKQIKGPLTPTSFESLLFPFQKKCLTWLVERERTAPSISAWGWTQRKLADGFTFHSSAFGHLSLSEPNTTVRGGLLAQDVGMGKTIEMLALIATNKANGPTLVVVPTTMLSVWMSEAKKHVPSLSVVKFHGARRTRNMDELRQTDIVLTTYRIVVNETQHHVPTIGAIRWGRIVLDESHEMRSITSATTKAVCRLYAPYRWCISATPWPKGFANVASMLAFWGVTPFDVHSNIVVRNTSCVTPTLLCDILSSTTWWQQKRHVRLNLPAITNRCIELQHSSSELYDKMCTSIIYRMEIDRSTHGINHLTRRLHYMRWLRQAAIHPLLNRFSHYGIPCTGQKIQTETNSIQTFIDTLGTTNYDQSLRDLIKSWADGNEKCAICMDAMDRPTVTPCHHMFCFECITSSYHHDSMHKCPLCRTPAGNSVLHELSVEEPVVTNVPSTWYTSDTNGQPVEMHKSTHDLLGALNGTHGHKIDRFIRLVKESTEKFVLFTRFHGAWKMTCDALQSAAISFVSIEGRMTPKRREKSIEQFQNNPDVRVFVLTTKTASVGITLTAGSHVVFLEPCIDPHIRKQAIGRVWRIGQQNPITVTTLKTLGTVDCVTDLDSHLNRSNLLDTSV